MKEDFKVRIKDNGDTTIDFTITYEDRELIECKNVEGIRNLGYERTLLMFLLKIIDADFTSYDDCKDFIDELFEMSKYVTKENSTKIIDVITSVKEKK